VLLIAGLAFVSGCQGCFGCATSPVDGDGSNLPRECQSAIPKIDPQRLDILFVIDNSSSMTAKQERVAQQLIAFVDELQKSGGLRKDFHVGVITTSVYLHGKTATGSFWVTYNEQAGRLRPIPNARPVADGGTEYDTETNNARFIDGDDPDLVAKFTRLVHQGDTGSGQETPFEAVRLALVSDLATTPIADGGNAEFFRDGARLAIVVVSDEDDCSEQVQPPPWESIVTIQSDHKIDDCLDGMNSLTKVIDYYKAFRGSGREILWAEIAPVGLGDTKQVQKILDVDAGEVRNIDCPDSFAPGFRHRQMAELFDLQLLDSVCRTSYQETLLRIADQAGVAQRLGLTQVPDVGVLQLVITRGDGTQKVCTFAQGLDGGTDGFRLAPDSGTAGNVEIEFQGECLRRANDTNVDVRLLCAM
jgi:hypothetical protein